MNAKELTELREKSADELRHKEHDLREQLFRLRLQQSIGQLEDALKLRRTRRDIARIKTILKEKGAPQGSAR